MIFVNYRSKWDSQALAPPAESCWDVEVLMRGCTHRPHRRGFDCFALCFYIQSASYGADSPLKYRADRHVGARGLHRQFHVFRLEDGKIAEHRAMRDDIGLLNQIKTK
jgi:hypothetical protein